MIQEAPARLRSRADKVAASRMGRCTHARSLSLSVGPERLCFSGMNGQSDTCWYARLESQGDESHGANQSGSFPDIRVNHDEFKTPILFYVF